MNRQGVEDLGAQKLPRVVLQLWSVSHVSPNPSNGH